MSTVADNSLIQIIIVSTVVLVTFALGYFAVIVAGNRKIIAEQQAKIDEIRKSEERYKTLFENSVAGMMKFNFTTWVVLEANQTLLVMFNCTTPYELQRVFIDVHFDSFYQIGKMLTKYGAIDLFEIPIVLKGEPPKKLLLSARREGKTEIAHGVVVQVNTQEKE
ncbi:MAG: hypothetical protein AB1600_03665 [Bacteroidota bacterium]